MNRNFYYALILLLGLSGCKDVTIELPESGQDDTVITDPDTTPDPDPDTTPDPDSDTTPDPDPDTTPDPDPDTTPDPDPIQAKILIPDLPAPDSSYLANSNVYTAQIKQNNGDWQTLHIKRSDSQDELIPSSNGDIYKDRSFHFTPFSFDPSEGPITIRVTKDPSVITENLASDMTNVEVINIDSGPVKIDDNTIEFTINTPKYIIVNFNVTSNQNNFNQFSVIKHPLAIFADEYNSDNEEPEAKDDQVKIVYDDTTTYQDMFDADMIVFREGFHDLKNHESQGAIPANNGKTIWFHPNSVVTGYIKRADGGGLGDDTLIYGRGVLYMGDFRNPVDTPTIGPYWRPGENNNSGTGMFEAVIVGDRATLRGLIIADIMWHGVVSRTNSTIENVKIWGWHGNNDAFRPSDGSIVKNSFLRAVDDALYTRAITAENNLFYQSYNGAIITCGWENVGDSGNTVLNDNIIYRPEWSALANNNGVIASQIGPFTECKNVTFNNTKIYGQIVGITNLKESSRLANSVFDADKHRGVPGIRDITFNNTIVYGGLLNKSRIDPSSNINIENVTFNKFKVTDYSSDYLDNSARDDLFEGAGATDDTVLQINLTIPAEPVLFSKMYEAENYDGNSGAQASGNNSRLGFIKNDTWASYNLNLTNITSDVELSINLVQNVKKDSVITAYVDDVMIDSFIVPKVGSQVATLTLDTNIINTLRLEFTHPTDTAFLMDIDSFTIQYEL